MENRRCQYVLLCAPRRNPQKGREAAALSNIKEIQEIQGGQEAPHDGDAINPQRCLSGTIPP